MYCKNCMTIRYFLVSVFVLVLAGLVFTDKMVYLKFISPYNVAIFITMVGFTIFIIKLIKYFLQKSSIFDQSNKIRNSTRESSKSMPGKKIDWPIKVLMPIISFSSPIWFIRSIWKVLFINFYFITSFTN